jgi:hypothetical protein
MGEKNRASLPLKTYVHYAPLLPIICQPTGPLAGGPQRRKLGEGYLH